MLIGNVKSYWRSLPGSSENNGDGDSQAAATYATAFQKDSEFYSFWRSVDAYKQSFKNKGI